jgi:hypothetical protein
VNALKSENIPLENLVGFGSDGCNTMFGSQNSVVSRLKAHFSGIIVQKCVCHSLHLCASEAYKVLPRQCEDLAREVYNFFLKQFQKAGSICRISTLLYSACNFLRNSDLNPK